MLTDDLYLLTTPQNEMPDGLFLVPLCTTREKLHRILSSLKTYEYLSDDRDTANFIDMLESLAYLDNPQDAPCYPQSACDEDTYSDDLFGFIDEVISSFQEGGAIKAVGYVIDQLGRIVIETALKIATVTAIGTIAGGIISVLIGGVLTDTITIGAGEVLDIVIDLTAYQTPTNIIEFVYEVAS